MTELNFGNIDKYKEQQEIRQRIRNVILGLSKQCREPYASALLNLLANLQPIRKATNLSRIDVGVRHHRENVLHSQINSKIECALVILRQMIINWWVDLLDGEDESLILTAEGVEPLLEKLEKYVTVGLGSHITIGDVRHGFWLVTENEYRQYMEEVR